MPGPPSRPAMVVRLAMGASLLASTLILSGDRSPYRFSFTDAEHQLLTFWRGDLLDQSSRDTVYSVTESPDTNLGVLVQFGITENAWFLFFGYGSD